MNETPATAEDVREAATLVRYVAQLDAQNCAPVISGREEALAARLEALAEKMESQQETDR